jgi:hypothetical protein
MLDLYTSVKNKVDTSASFVCRKNPIVRPRFDQHPPTNQALTKAGMEGWVGIPVPLFT